MRLKKVKGAKEKVENSSYVVLTPEKYKGRYSTLFDNDNPIRVEIGMGKGRFIIENAKKYPNINFIGVEKYDSVMIRAIEKLTDLELPNLKLINADALNIQNFFEKEIDLVYLNFSDPWPKKRHQNRRLTSKIFLDKYKNIFRENAHIIMKTDNRSLFEFSVKSLTDYGYKIENISLDLYADDTSENIQTEYEEKFSAKGYTIYYMDIIKK